MAKKKHTNRKPIPENETKAERFVRVVSPRVVKAVKAITVIGYCTGTTYESTPEQTKQIIETLFFAVSGLESRFETKKPVDATFEFKA